MNHYISLILVDNNIMFRSSIKEFLESNPQIQIIGEASNGKEYLEMVETKCPDITIMDLYMPVLDGIGASNERLKQNPKEKIIILTTQVGAIHSRLMIDIDFKGCVLKENIYKELIPAIKSVLHNGYFFNGVAMLRRPKYNESLNNWG